MRANETEPAVETALLNHNGTIGTYALRINGLWWRDTGYDIHLLGKTLAGVALDRGMTGLISAKGARYNDTIRAELRTDTSDGASMAFYEAKDTLPLDGLYDLGIVAAAASNPRNRLGHKIGIIETLRAPEIGRFDMGGYTFINRGIPELEGAVVLPRSRPVSTLQSTAIASGYGFQQK